MTTPDPLAGQPTIWLPKQPPLRTAEENLRDADAHLVTGLLEALEHLRNADRQRAMRALMEATESAERVIG